MSIYLSVNEVGDPFLKFVGFLQPIIMDINPVFTIYKIKINLKEVWGFVYKL